MKSFLMSVPIALLICVLGVHADPPRLLTRHSEKMFDVSLTSDDSLEGYLIDPFGKVLKGTGVTIVQNRKVIWTGKTNAEGYFQVKGLSTGVYEVNSDRLAASCRVWSKEAAPPRASRSLLLTRDLAPAAGTLGPRSDDLTIRVSGFPTLTLPRIITRDVRKLMSP